MSKASPSRIIHALNNLDGYNLTTTDRTCIEYCLKVVYSIKTMFEAPNAMFKHLADMTESKETLIRCADCKYYDRTERCNCMYRQFENVSESDYCSLAERKEE